MSNYSVIGKPMPRVDAVDKVTGAARYAADVNLPGMLWGRFLRCPHAHAKILRIDTSRAEKLPGVKAIITSQNASGASLRSEDSVHGMSISQGLFASDVARYQGEKIAVVAAEEAGICADALDLIDVEYEVLPSVTDVMQAIREDAPRVREDAKTAVGPHGETLYNIAGEAHDTKGDVEQGFAEADLVLEDWYSIPRVHQTYLEPHACTAYVDPSGKVTVWTSTQSIFGIRSGVASSLGIPASRINVIGQTIGGGFGGKFGMLVHPYAVLLSQATGRAVKIVMSRHEEFLDGRPAPGAVFWVKTGFKRDGIITARQAVGYWDSGCVPGASLHATGRIAGVYKIENVKWHAYGVYTNKPGTTAYRAPGAPQGTFASEAQLNQGAQALGIDPVELRLKNMIGNGESTRGRTYHYIAFKETLEAVAKKAGWRERPHEPNRGWGVAVGEWTNGAGPASAMVTLQDDGTVTVLSGAMDISGTDTGMAMIAAEVLGMDFKDIRVIRGDTDSVPFATGSGGSVVLFSMGNAVKRAAEALRERLMALAADQLKVTVEDLLIKDRKVMVRNDQDQSIPLGDLGQISLRTTGGPMVGTGTFANEGSSGVISAQIVQVEVDPETGRARPLKLYHALDVGTAINPLEIEGQMEGGAMQSLAWGWMEEMKFTENGLMANPNLSDYLLPTTLDAPVLMENVIVECPSERGPFGVKGIGEPPIAPTVAAVQSAVADATGAWVNHLPLTPEHVFEGLQRVNGNASNGHRNGQAVSDNTAQGAAQKPVHGAVSETR